MGVRIVQSEIGRVLTSNRFIAFTKRLEALLVSGCG